MLSGYGFGCRRIGISYDFSQFKARRIPVQKGTAPLPGKYEYNQYNILNQFNLRIRTRNRHDRKLAFGLMVFPSQSFFFANKSRIYSLSLLRFPILISYQLVFFLSFFPSLLPSRPKVHKATQERGEIMKSQSVPLGETEPRNIQYRRTKEGTAEKEVSRIRQLA